MSLAVAQGTSLFIIMRKSQLEYRLMQITTQIRDLALASGQASQDMMTQYQTALATSEGMDDTSSVAADVWASDEFNAEYNAMMLQYQAKEKMLETEKLQIETEHKALETTAEGVDKMIESNIKNTFGYMK